MESILDSTKDYIGIPTDSHAFDTALLSSINTALSFLYQMGLGPRDGFYVTDASMTWNEFLGVESFTLSSARTYVHICAKLDVDPPAASSILDSMNRKKNEIEWRLTALAENDQKNED